MLSKFYERFSKMSDDEVKKIFLEMYPFYAEDIESTSEEEDPELRKTLLGCLGNELDEIHEYGLSPNWIDGVDEGDLIENIEDYNSKIYDTPGEFKLTSKEDAVALYTRLESLYDSLSADDEFSAKEACATEDVSANTGGIAKEIKPTLQKMFDDYLNEFKSVIPGYKMEPRAEFEYSDSFYIDYFAMKPTYTKEDAKKALNIFEKHVSAILVFIDILKSKYTNIQYEIGKTPVSSARLGKSLFVYNLPLKELEENSKTHKDVSSTESFDSVEKELLEAIKRGRTNIL